MLFQSSQCVDVAQRSRSSLVLNHRSFFLLAVRLLGSLLFCSFFCLGSIFEDTAVRQDDTLSVLVEFDHLERQFLIELSLRTVFLNEVLRSCETFYTVRQSYYSALIQHFDDSTFVYRTYSEYSFEYIPRILFELLVTEAQTTVFLVDFQNHYIDVCTDLSELRIHRS